MKEKIKEILKKCGLQEKDICISNFCESDVFDSLMIADIIITIENEFNIEIDGEDIVPYNFENLSTLANLVERYIKD